MTKKKALMTAGRSLLLEGQDPVPRLSAAGLSGCIVAPMSAVRPLRSHWTTRPEIRGTRPGCLDTFLPAEFFLCKVH